MTILHIDPASAARGVSITVPELKDAVMDAVFAQGSQLQADSLSSGHMGEHQAVDASRACIRQYVQMLADRNDAIADANVGISVENAIARGCGLRLEGATVRQRGLQADAYWEYNAFNQEASQVIRQTEAPRLLQEVIPARPIGVEYDTYESLYAYHTGSAQIMTPGQTVFPRADYSGATTKHPMHWLVTSTTSEWTRRFKAGAPSPLNEATEKAAAARSALERLYEDLLANGALGLDFPGVYQSGAPYFASATDFSSATFGAKIQAIHDAFNAIEVANNYTAEGFTHAIVDARLWNNIFSLNNIDAGGTAQGGQQLLEALRSRGITSITRIPTLPASIRGPKYAGMLLWNARAQAALNRPVGLGVTPVSTATIHSSETIWAMKVGAIDNPMPNETAIVDFKVLA